MSLSAFSPLSVYCKISQISLGAITTSANLVVNSRQSDPILGAEPLGIGTSSEICSSELEAKTSAPSEWESSAAWPRMADFATRHPLSLFLLFLRMWLLWSGKRKKLLEPSELAAEASSSLREFALKQANRWVKNLSVNSI